MALLDSVKNYIRVTDSAEDSAILELINAAEEYLYEAGVEKDDDDALYVLAVKKLVSFWYYKRSIEGGDKIPDFFISIISQLRKRKRR
jgi:uncharacterized phage protein (predicted DNA packaging)